MAKDNHFLLLTLRGNVIGDSVSETALAKKIIEEKSKEYNIQKNKIKIYYPAGSLIYELMKHNKYLAPILIKEFDLLNKPQVSKLKKLWLTLKGAYKIYKRVKQANIENVIYLGKEYKIREIIARLIAFSLNAKFSKSGFEQALGYSAELNFTKEEEKKIKKYLKGKKKQRVVICTEASNLDKRWDLKNFIKLIYFLIDKGFYVYLVGIEEDYNHQIIKSFNQNKKFINLLKILSNF